MRGGDSSGLRAYNERLIVSEVMRAGALSKAEIARATGLSGQAASVIVNRLLEDGLLVKRAKVRGQIGQPSTPIAVNPEGAYALGIKIGRRSIDAILVNLLGEILDRCAERYDVPMPGPTLASAERHAAALLEALGSARRQRVVGLGIAMPGELHSWAAELGLEPGALDGWRDLDVAAALGEATGLDASLYNDATAACAAEMIAGDGIETRSALYIYLGTFIGGGVVLDGKLYRGEQLNAGAVGSMPTCDDDPEGRPGQLIHAASVLDLERRFAAAGIDPSEALSGDPTDQTNEIFDAWSAQAVSAVARAVVSALGVIDFEAVVIDGLLPPWWRRSFRHRLVRELGRFNRSGLSRAEVGTGSIGPLARVLGAAMLPLKARFSPDPELVIRSGGPPATLPNGARSDPASG